MISKKLGAIASIALLAGSGQAMVIGGSNLGFGGYPESSCRKPTRPYRPSTFSSQWEVDRFNQQVTAYNSDLDRFIACTREYLENAQNDMKRIKERMDETLENARR